MRGLGILVLADISGFTAFVTGTELEHGPQIIGALLEAVMRRLSPPLEIQEVEGDAVFALGADEALPAPAHVLDAFDAAFAAFGDLRRELAADQSCSCGACRGVARLDLKIVAHRGRFLRHAVGGHSQVAGPDVILTHRLLKNGVTTSRAYLLVTEAMGVAGRRPGPRRPGRARRVLRAPRRRALLRAGSRAPRCAGGRRRGVRGSVAPALLPYRSWPPTRTTSWGVT